MRSTTQTQAKLVIKRALITLIGALLLTLWPAQPAAAAGVVGDGTPASCTEQALRNAVAGGGKVTFNCGANPVTITLTSTLIINKATEIDGGGNQQGGLITLSGGGRVRVLLVNYQSSLTIRNLTIRDGIQPGEDGRGGGLSTQGFVNLTIINAIFLNNDGTPANREGGGGAIYVHNGSTVLIQQSHFADNRGINGGAIYILGSSMTVENSTFINNDSTPGGAASAGYDGRFGAGGGIYIDGARYKPDNPTGGQIIIRDTLFQGNKAAGQGGGLFSYVYDPDTVTVERVAFIENEVVPNAIGNAGIGGGMRHGNGRLTLSDSLFWKNKAGKAGGGLWSGRDYPATLVNVTFVGNRVEAGDRSGQGGAMYLDDGTWDIVNATIVDNYADFMAGGVYVVVSRADVGLRNSIIARNVAGDGTRIWNQCSKPLTRGDHNIQSPSLAQRDGGDYPCSPGITFADPQIYDLADNGGHSPTIALRPGSPAIGAGNNCPATDQRGVARSTCDIGAFAFTTDPAPTPPPTTPPTPPAPGVTTLIYLPLVRR